MASRQRQLQVVEDEELMSLVVESRDSDAFATLYDRYSRAAYSLAYRMLGDKQAAGDLLQDVFMEVWESADKYRAERGSLRTWILAIIHHRAMNRLRSASSRRRVQVRVEAMAQTSQPSEAFSEAWRSTQRDEVRRALSSLPPEQMEVLELAYFSGYKQREIAEHLDLPLGTVKSRTRLSLKRLKSHFDALDTEVRRWKRWIGRASKSSRRTTPWASFRTKSASRSKPTWSSIPSCAPR
ncbi:MAG: sigma-70 family RNA polymerase sigma factor [Rubrobacteraceae bacterium]